jgi:phosphoglycerate dehydrogenase-like enzyme
MEVKVSNIAFSKNSYLVEELLKEFPDAKVNKEGNRFQGQELVKYFDGAEGAIVGLESITGPFLDQLPNLKIIAKFGVGLDNIDKEACEVRNVRLGWTGGVNKVSVAEMSLGFMLALRRNLYSTSNDLKGLVWNKSGGFQLSGCTIGIIGMGNIGKELVRLLEPFQCCILFSDIVRMDGFAEENGLTQVSKEELFSSSDIVSLHVPFTKDTSNLINLEVLKKMKNTSFLINTARGGIVNEQDLKYALQNSIIGGAALDVYEIEPPSDKELLNLPNLICTPHTGGNSYEAVVAMGLSAIKHLVHYRDHHFTKQS